MFYLGAALFFVLTAVLILELTRRDLRPPGALRVEIRTWYRDMRAAERAGLIAERDLAIAHLCALFKELRWSRRWRK